MRPALYILMLLLLTLSLKPCLDRASAVSGDQQTVAMAHIHQDHQDADADGCSPFCSCHCCHTHYQPQGIDAADYTSSQHIVQQIDLYKNGFPSSLAYSVWQPPKVA